MLAVEKIAGDCSCLLLFGESNLRPPALFLTLFLCIFGLAFSKSSILHKNCHIVSVMMSALDSHIVIVSAMMSALGSECYDGVLGSECYDECVRE